MGTAISEATPVVRDAMREKLAKVHASFYPDLQKVLKPEQYARLRQIGWQSQGAGALSDPELIKILDINPEQRQKIADLEQEFQSKFRAALNPPNGPPNAGDPEFSKQIDALQADRTQKLLAVLTKTQQEKFAELKGKPYDIRLL